MMGADTLFRELKGTVETIANTAANREKEIVAMWIALLFTGLFFAAAVYNIGAGHGISLNAAVNLALSFACSQLYFLMRRERRLIDEFNLWFAENSAALRQGPVAYHDVELDLDTEITQFQLQASFLVVTFTVRSRPYIVGRQSILFPA